ncbi:MAG: very short patch repair endonuclease [Hyphomonadaceae bacterium]
MTRADVFAPEKRAAIMRAVKSADTKPELAVRRAARALGAGYRLGGWALPGKPDLVFPGRKRVIFVHGCFWHGHDCKRGARAPKDNAAYWQAKIARNRARDARALAALEEAGWRALVIWECETRGPEALEHRLRDFLKSA